MNRVILMGRLTKDPEVFVKSKDGKEVVSHALFTVAVNREYKVDGEYKADFISCVAFGKTAEFLDKYFIKGDKILVEGRWTTDSYTDKDGNKRYSNNCNVFNIEFVENKKDSGSYESVPDPLMDEKESDSKPRSRSKRG